MTPRLEVPCTHCGHPYARHTASRYEHKAYSHSLGLHDCQVYGCECPSFTLRKHPEPRDPNKEHQRLVGVCSRCGQPWLDGHENVKCKASR